MALRGWKPISSRLMYVCRGHELRIIRIIIIPVLALIFDVPSALYAQSSYELVLVLLSQAAPMEVYAMLGIRLRQSQHLF
jgi:hypothetical protein